MESAKQSRRKINLQRIRNGSLLLIIKREGGGDITKRIEALPWQEEVASITKTTGEDVVVVWSVRGAAGTG